MHMFRMIKYSITVYELGSKHFYRHTGTFEMMGYGFQMKSDPSA